MSSTVTISKVSMPKACVSCQHFQHIGRCADEYSPHKTSWGARKLNTKYGQCHHHLIEVFATELCKQFKQEPDADVFPVENRPKPKEPRTATSKTNLGSDGYEADD